MMIVNRERTCPHARTAVAVSLPTANHVRDYGSSNIRDLVRLTWHQSITFWTTWKSHQGASLFQVLNYNRKCQVTQVVEYAIETLQNS